MFRTAMLASVVSSVALMSGAKAHVIFYDVGIFRTSFLDGSSFTLDGTSMGRHVLNLTPGVAQLSGLDDGLTTSPAPNSLNGDFPVFTSMSINDSRPALTLTQAANFGSRDLPPRVDLQLLSGPPVVFDLGTFDVTVTPVASTDLDGGRIASFLETTNVGTVPEPQTWAMMLLGFSMMGYLGYARRRRNESV